VLTVEWARERWANTGRQEEFTFDVYFIVEFHLMVNSNRSDRVSRAIMSDPIEASVPPFSLLRCPRCQSQLSLGRDQASCHNERCIYSDQKFPLLNGQPVLIDFADSLFGRSNYQTGNGSALLRDLTRNKFRSRLHLLVDGTNPVAAKNCDLFLSLIKAQTEHPRILVIGGGAVGLGSEKLYRDPNLDLISTDVYASPSTALLCDAHKLPFETQTFDGIWIQAVLEHVLDPQVVVAEIHRVLKQNGYVYAETPFMQQVHERAYDFSRFTRSGHRWLFGQFEEISSGSVTGPAIAFLWSMRYLLRALGAGEKLSRAISLLFFWVRFLDRFCQPQKAADAAGGVFFLGRRSETRISAASMVRYYEQGS
jgi:SAM-dependent methyltransferase